MSMQSADEFERTLRAVLPPHLHELAALVAPLFAEAARGALGIDELRRRLTATGQAGAIADALAGRQLSVGEAMLSFGAGAQTGDVRIGDVAGRDVITLNINTGRLGSPEAPTLRRPGSVYLYREEPAGASAMALRLRLQLRGLAVTPGPDAPPQIHHAALASAAACLLHISEASLADEKGLKRNMDVIKAEKLHRPLPVVVVRDGVSARELRGLLPLGDDGWTDAEPGAIGSLSNPAMNRAAKAVLAALFETYAAGLLDGETLAMGFYTSQPRGEIGTPALLVDWRSVYQPYPNPDDWTDLLLPALTDLRISLGGTAMAQIELSALARLSAGVALGYAFRSVTRTSFRMRQGPAWWHTAAHDPAARPFGQPEPALVGPGPDLSVELNITQPTGKLSADVTYHIDAVGLPVGRRLRLELPGGPTAQLAEADAQAIASQVRTLIQAHKQRDGVTHLFMAAPFGLALMIGWHLNTLTPVQCYEMPEGTTRYEPACRLDRL